MPRSNQPKPVDLYGAFPGGMQGIMALEEACQAGPLDPFIYELVKMRASQINGCAFCLDMHSKDARAMGETEQRLYMLNAWHESDLYNEQERAALALTEAITLISEHHVPEEIEAEARRVFDEESYANLVFAIAAINVWNRLAITGHSRSGHYKSDKSPIERAS